MVRVLAVSIIVTIVVLFTAVSNIAQSIDSNQSGKGPGVTTSWEMYRQQQVEMQLEMQRQQLEMELGKQRIERQKKQME